MERKEMEQDFTRVRIDASVVVGILRDAWRHGGLEKALELGKQCISGLSDEQITAIAAGRATLTGNTTEGVVYKTVSPGAYAGDSLKF